MLRGQVPGGQVLGPTYDYTQRLLDFALLADSDENSGNAHRDGNAATARAQVHHVSRPEAMPRVVSRSSNGNSNS